MITVRALALDLAHRATGMAGTHDGSDWPLLWCNTIRPPDGGHSAVAHTHVALVAVIRKMRPDLAVIEDVFTGRSPRTGLTLAELHGVIKQQLWRSRVPYVVVNPQSRAIYACGDGRADKAAVLAAARATYGHLVGGPANIRDDHQADALVLLALALDALGQPLAAVAEDRRRAITAINWQPIRESSAGRRDTASAGRPR